MNEEQKTQILTLNGSQLFKFFLFFLVAWTLVLSVWLYTYSIREGGLPCWDGFDRCAWGASLMTALQDGDFYVFWNYTNQQVVWPFLHSWITMAVFMVFGPTLPAARLIALGSYFGASCLILYWFVRAQKLETAQENAHPLYFAVGAMVSWALFTTSPVVAAHAASIMSELPGFFLVMAALCALPKDENEPLWRTILAGFFLGLLFYYKYNFAVLTFVGVGLARFAKHRWAIPRLFQKQDLVLFGVPMVMLAAWLLPFMWAKLYGLLGFVVNNPEARMPFSILSLLYYPQLAPAEYFSHPFICLLLLAPIILTLIFSRRLDLSNPIIACFLIHFAAAFIHPMKDVRFIFIPMGLFYLIVGESFAGMLQQWDVTQKKDRKWAVISATILLLIGVFLFQTNFNRKNHASRYQDYLAPIHAFLDHVTVDDHIALLVSHDLVNPPAISFHLVKGLNTQQNPLDDLPWRWRHLYLFEKGEPVRAIPEEERFKNLRHEFYSGKTDTVVTLQSTAPWKIARFDDLFGGAHEYANLVPYMGEFELVFERTFFKTDALLRVYRLKQE
jgi:4-amino-4-deoxy-L-arabinose transferase-like glycosyltransferase